VSLSPAHNRPTTTVDPESSLLWSELDAMEAAGAAPGLPRAPDDDELYAYLGTQLRWPLVLQVVGTVTMLVAMTHFALSRTAFAPYGLVVLGAAAVASVGLITSTRRPRVSRDTHRALAGWRAQDETVSVDVLLPSCGEPLAVLENTYRHVAAMHAKGPLTVYVLDDAASPDVELLAARYGFHYSSRPDRGRLKKAGNLAHGFGLGTGDVVVVFDADFVPRPDFLAHLLPYLDDPTIGIVQTPQYFDTHRGQNWLERGAGATQEFFYRWVQPSRDRWDASICVGTNAVYRRAALAAAGGFAQVGHSEDVHTGVNLMKAGYRTQYVPVLVAKGLCPDELPAFVNQQYRWCTGSMSLLVDRGFHRAGLGLRRYLCFWSGFLYYLGSALFAFCLPVPTLLMLWAFPGGIDALHYVWLLPALLVTWFLWPTARRATGSLSVVRVQMITQYVHALAVWDTFRDRRAEWVPTGAVGKGSTLSARAVRLMRVHVGVTQGLFWAGLLVNVDRIQPVALPVLVCLGLLIQAVTAPAVLGLGLARD
jgi:cellulose synthase (UDP-forming)